jgi:transcriptional regulator with XRE-family HTH domain
MNRIKEVLNEKGIKRTWLAEKLGKSFKVASVLSAIDNSYQVETLYRIAERLQVSVRDWLVEDKNKK